MMDKPLNYRSYIKRHMRKQGKWKIEQPEYLSGLFTSRYGDEFYLHFVCPCCGEQINQLKKLNMKAGEITIDFEKSVAGEMMNDLRRQLVIHYQSQCGYARDRREKTAEILLDKLKDEIYR